jgi:vacuolar-type H+-ATPase subunit I/STV1
MDKLKLEIINKLLMLTSNKEIEDLKEYVQQAVYREIDEDDKQQEEFKKWKEQNGSKENK